MGWESPEAERRFASRLHAGEGCVCKGDINNCPAWARAVAEAAREDAA